MKSLSIPLCVILFILLLLVWPRFGTEVSFPPLDVILILVQIICSIVLASYAALAFHSWKREKKKRLSSIIQDEALELLKLCWRIISFISAIRGDKLPAELSLIGYKGGRYEDILPHIHEFFVKIQRNTDDLQCLIYPDIDNDFLLKKSIQDLLVYFLLFKKAIEEQDKEKIKFRDVEFNRNDILKGSSMDEGYARGMLRQYVRLSEGVLSRLIN